MGQDGVPDKYGNTQDRIEFCCFPDCGCDGARLCMAENGPSWGATNLNIEHRSERSGYAPPRSKAK